MAATGKVDVLMTGLGFANGVALGSDDSFVLVNETFMFLTLLRYWLKGPKAGSHDVFVAGLPGFPDNIHLDESDNSFWIGIFSLPPPGMSTVCRAPISAKDYSTYRFIS